MSAKWTVQIIKDPNYYYMPGGYENILYFDNLKDAEGEFSLYLRHERIGNTKNFEGYVYRGELLDVTDMYPDFRMYEGPRGGIRRERV